MRLPLANRPPPEPTERIDNITSVDEDSQQLLDRSLYIVAAFSGISVVVGTMFGIVDPAESSALYVFMVLLWIAAFAKRLGYRIRSFILLTVALLAIVQNLAQYGVFEQSRLLIFAVTVLAIALWGARAGIGVSIVGVVIFVAAGYRQSNGLLVPDPDSVLSYLAGDDWFTIVARFVLIIVISAYMVSRIVERAQATLKRQQALSEAVAEERALLVERVGERTRALRLAAEVGRNLTQITSEQELVLNLVNQVREAFSYYYVQVYLQHEDDDDKLILVGGTGEPGITMLKAGHTITVGQGLVGRAFKKAAPVIAPDVAHSNEWVYNPLLPDTRSEIAVPILFGNRPLGVLDVQHNVPRGISEIDAGLLDSIAKQVGIALRNAQLYRATQSRGEREMRSNRVRQSIAEAADLDTLLRTAVRELGVALGADQTTIRLDTARVAIGEVRYDP